VLSDLLEVWTDANGIPHSLACRSNVLQAVARHDDGRRLSLQCTGAGELQEAGIRRGARWFGEHAGCAGELEDAG